jgi:hypothetical protein
MSSAFGNIRAAIGAASIASVSGGSFARNQARRDRAADGNTNITGIDVMTESPTMSVTTGDLAALFTALTGGAAVGFPFVAGVTAEVVFPKSAAAGPGHAGGATSARRLFALADVFLDSISWSRGEVAQATYTAYAKTTDGTTVPYTVTNVAAPAAVPSQPSWVLTSALINGVACQIDSLTINLDHKASNSDGRCFNQGFAFPIVVHAAGVMGAGDVNATIETGDLDIVFANGDAVFVFQERQANGVAYTGATLTVTLNASFVNPDESISPAQRSSRTVYIRGILDGTGAPFSALYS